MAEVVNEALIRNFKHADEEPVLDRDSDHVYYELRGELIRDELGDTLLVEEPLAIALVHELATVSDPAFDFEDNELHIEPIEASSYLHKGDWRAFSEGIRHQRRYFDEAAANLLGSILRGTDTFVSSDGHPAIRTIHPGGPDATCFRARHANDDLSRIRMYLAPHRELGSPPRNLATPGRMNAAGIPVFYAAFDPLTCVSEIHVPVGGIAAVAKFALLRPVRVLDLTVFDEGPEHISYFQRDRLEILGHSLFLADFHGEMRRPILPQDEPIDYVPTQAVADYLAHRFSPQLDGLIYSSAQTTPSGRNIVLFTHAAVVKEPGPADIPSSPVDRLRGTLFDSSYIIDEAPDPEGRKTTQEGPYPGSDFVLDLTEPASQPDIPPTLVYIDGSLEFARVTSISLETETIHPVMAPRRHYSGSPTGRGR